MENYTYVTAYVPPKEGQLYDDDLVFCVEFRTPEFEKQGQTYYAKFKVNDYDPVHAVEDLICFESAGGKLVGDRCDESIILDFPKIYGIQAAASEKFKDRRLSLEDGAEELAVFLDAECQKVLKQEKWA